MFIVFYVVKILSILCIYDLLHILLFCDTLTDLWNVHTHARTYVLGWEDLRKTTEHISQASQ
jgi:hypothetical protein